MSSEILPHASQGESPGGELMKLRLCLSAAIAFAMAVSVCAQNNQLTPLAVEDAVGVREFGQSVTPVQLSPDGKVVAYTVADNRKRIVSPVSESQDRYARTGVSWLAVGVDIFISNTESGETQNLTHGNGNNWSPVWSPDGRYLGFLSDRGSSGQANLWVWEANTNNLRKVSDVSVRTFQDIQWLPDSKAILTTVLPEGLDLEDYINRLHGQEGQMPKKSKVSVIVYKSAASSLDSVHAPTSDPWRLDSLPVDLAVIDVSTGETRRVIRELDRLGRYVSSPDSLHIAFTTPKRFERAASQQILWDMKVSAIATGKTTTVAPDIRMDFGGIAFSWSPDSLRLVYRTGGELESRHDCYIIEVAGGVPRNVTVFPADNLSTMYMPPLWDDDGRFVYFTRGDALWRASATEAKPVELARLSEERVLELIPRGENRLWSPDHGKTTIVLTRGNDGTKSGFQRIDLMSGRAARLLEDTACHTCLNAIQHVSAAPESQEVAYFSEDAQHDPNLWLAKADFRNPRRITRLNPQFENRELGAARSVEWRSLDGDLLHGALLLPAGYEEGKRYPLIVWVYGGDSSLRRLNHFGLISSGVFNFQLLATRGFAVLYPDARQRLGTPMADLTKAVLPGVNKVIEMGIADPDRLGVMGHSYGGYSTLSLIVQTKRFKAAIAADGYADLMGHYGEMVASGTAFGTAIEEHGQGLMGGTPWEFRERYIENSPIFYLDRVETPVLLVHGSKDSNIFPFLSDEVFVALRRLGKEVEYAKYEGEEHSPAYWSYANQVDFCNRMIAWFDDHLKKSRDKTPAK